MRTRFFISYSFVVSCTPQRAHPRLPSPGRVQAKGWPAGCRGRVPVRKRAGIPGTGDAPSAERVVDLAGAGIWLTRQIGHRRRVCNVMTRVLSIGTGRSRKSRRGPSVVDILAVAEDGDASRARKRQGSFVAWPCACVAARSPVWDRAPPPSALGWPPRPWLEGVGLKGRTRVANGIDIVHVPQTPPLPRVWSTSP